ncbi:MULTISPECIES: hypothetical protein [unclassified Streptomyces]
MGFTANGDRVRLMTLRRGTAAGSARHALMRRLDEILPIDDSSTYYQ